MYNDFDLKDMSDYQWETLGTVAVDSGTLMVVDPCYVLPDKKRYPQDEAPGVDYSDMLDAYAEDQHTEPVVAPWGESMGLCIGTTHGDGQYTVFGVKDQYGRVRAWLVVTDDMAQPEEDEDDYAEDEEDAA